MVNGGEYPRGRDNDRSELYAGMCPWREVNEKSLFFGPPSGESADAGGQSLLGLSPWRHIEADGMLMVR
jgi:hypothetical protein